MSRLFTQGALVLIPVVVTVVILQWLVRAIDALTPTALPVWLKVILALAAVIVIGWMANFWGTRWLVHLGEAVLARIPLVRTIYGSVKQMAEALADSKKFLGRPVLVPVGPADTLVMGFFVGEVRVPEREDPWACVFVPMSLNITGGSTCSSRWNPSSISPESTRRKLSASSSPRERPCPAE